MHHTILQPGRMIWSLLLGGALGGVAFAQQPEKPTTPPGQAPTPTTSVGPAKNISGTDQAQSLQKSAKAIILGIGGNQKVGMSTKKKIATVDNPKSTVVSVQAVEGEPTLVLIKGIESGQARIVLKDEDGKEEAFDVSVQLDIEYLKSVLARAIPTANLTLIPSANNTVVISGHVARSEDVDLVIRTAASVLGDANRVVNAIRVGGVQQVQLDVVIAQVSRGEFRRMSFDFFTDGRQHLFSSTVGGGFFVPSGPITGAFPGSAQIANSIGLPNGAPANFFLGIFTDNQDFFGLLQALRDENVLKLLAKPSLVAMSGRPASFLSGGEQAIPVPAGLGQVGVQFEEFGTRLNFLPIVLGNGKISLEVEPEVSNLDASFGTSINGTVVPGRTTQRVHTSVELEDGQTFVLGGLIQHNVSGDTRKVPILGDLPFLGAAFRRIQYNETETELIIMVTVHLVDAMSCDQAPKIFPGQETRSPDDFELFLEGILEAPRGPRHVFDGKKYVPAYKNGPSAGAYPCAGGSGACGTSACKTNCGPAVGCGTTGCSAPAATGCVDARQVLSPAPVTVIRPGTPTGMMPADLQQPKTLPAIVPTSGSKDQ